MIQHLLDLGVNPRIAVALSRMAAAGHLPKVSKSQLRTASEMASESLCASIADTFHKVAKAVAEDEDEDEGENSIRKDERKVAEWTVKLGYALAKHLGADEETALTASMYAFTQIPASHEVQAEVLEAEWWQDGRSERK